MDQAADNTAVKLASPGLARAFRWAASLHIVALIAQVALAPLFLAGYAQALVWHRANARVVVALGLVVALTALVRGPRNTGPWVTLMAVALPALEATQIWLGQTGRTEPHVLTALAIWSFGIAVATKAWAAVRAV